MSKIAIVTDSTGDIPVKLAEELNINVIPLNVHFHEEVFKDGVDINHNSFFEKLKVSPVPPRTSQPSPGDFHKVYKALLAEGAETIISIHISKELSGTYQSATIARDMLPEAKIHIIDSKSASMGLGMIAINAAKAVLEGKEVQEIVAMAEEMVDNHKVMFAVDTLEYLHRNGRIGGAAKLIGGLLNVKPMLEVDSDGKVAPLGKIRGKAKVVPFLLEQTQTFLEGYQGEVDLSVIHAQEPVLAQEILAQFKGQFAVRNGYLAELGSVIGTHVGPGTIGIIVQKL
jgi:DegV family protein with EDD domain